jgi:hypothetical protein
MTKRKDPPEPLGPGFIAAEATALATWATARQEFAQLVRDLIPVADKQAKKGRSRLLAVIGKLLGEQKLNNYTDPKIREALRKLEGERQK